MRSTALNPVETLRCVDNAVDRFYGDLDELERAIGMVMVGRHYGWRVLLLAHSPKTVRDRCRLLGLDSIRTATPELGVLAHRSVALSRVLGTIHYWQAVRRQVSSVCSSLVVSFSPKAAETTTCGAIEK